MALTDKLAAIGDQVRRIYKTEDKMTLEQMALNLSNVISASDLPSAESGAFGKVGSNEEYGLQSATPSGAIDNPWTAGYQFVPAEAFAVVGFRIYRNSGAAYAIKSPLRLWDSTDRVLAEVEVNINTGEWFDMYLDKPVNVDVGETYRIGCYAGGYTYSSNWTKNSKISSLKGCYNTGDGVPNTIEDMYIYGMYDIIIAPVQAELPDTYQVERTTMDDIAEEVQRITGATYKLSTAQIITALQGVAVQTTE